jgi:hypothetical protein
VSSSDCRYWRRRPWKLPEGPGFLGLSLDAAAFLLGLQAITERVRVKLQRVTRRETKSVVEEESCDHKCVRTQSQDSGCVAYHILSPS